MVECQPQIKLNSTNMVTVPSGNEYLGKFKNKLPEHSK